MRRDRGPDDVVCLRGDDCPLFHRFAPLGRTQERIDEACVLVDQNGELCAFNRRGYELTRRVNGTTPDTAVQALDTCLDPDRREAYRQMFDAAIEGQVSQVSVLLEAHDGEELALELRACPAAHFLDQPGILLFARDITNRVLEHRELRARLTQQRLIARLGSFALRAPERGDLLDHAVQAMAEGLDTPMAKVLLLEDGGARLRLVSGVGWQPGNVGERTFELSEPSQASYTLAVGEPVIVEDLASDTRFRGPQLLFDHGVVSGLSVIVGDPREPWGVLGAHTDQPRTFTEYDVNHLRAIANLLAASLDRHRLDQTRSRLMSELDHRVKNTLASIASLAEQTAARISDTRSFVDSFVPRLHSLARVHEGLANARWGPIELAELIRLVLRPFEDEPGPDDTPQSERVSLTGDNVRVAGHVANPVGMALHELATNASKYGAFTAPQGRVEIRVTAVEGNTIRLQWIERDGPNVTPPKELGFGIGLIEGLVEHQLGGTMRLDFTPEGLHAELTFPQRKR